MPYSKNLYWDTSVWIAWVTNEVRPNQEMVGVEECVKVIEKRQVLMFTSSVIYTEIDQLRFSEEEAARFARLAGRRNVRIEPIELRIGALSISIRTFYRNLSKKDGKPEITDHDADHLATAIHYKADAFHTFDDGQKGGRSLLSLNGDVAGHPLVICKPPITQYELFR